MSDDRSKNKDEKLLYCSFCGKSQHEVRKLIAGPSVFICDECVDLLRRLRGDFLKVDLGDCQWHASRMLDLCIGLHLSKYDQYAGQFRLTYLHFSRC